MGFHAPVIEYSDGYHEVFMKGSRSLGLPGEPVLPVKPVAILLPPASVVESVSVVPGDWRYADAVARNPMARLGVLDNFGGDYSLYVWNAPLPGDLTQAAAGERNPSVLGRDCWRIPAGNSVVALLSPR